MKSHAKSLILTIFLFWLLVYWSHPWEAELKLDGMTYAAMAKNILLTGDWRTLHYSDYFLPDFHQHPHLVFWMQALVFKLFGISEIKARVLPSFFALGTLGLLFWYSKLRTGELKAGFLSCLVLLTTTRYVKFSSDLYLDGPLSFFMLLAAIGGFYCQSAVRADRVRAVFLFGFGFAAALLCKGLVALALPGGFAALAVYQAGLRKDRAAAFRTLKLLGLGVGLGLVFLIPWYLFVDGAAFLRHYWGTSVAYRLDSKSWRDQVGPALHLMKVYWPWWPLALWGAWRVFRHPTQQRDSLFVALAIGGAVFAAFSWVGHHIEHYFLPVYVFSAVVVGHSLFELPWWQRNLDKLNSGTRVVVIVGAFLMAVLPIKLHGKRAPDLKDALRTAMQRCDSQRIKQVLVTKTSEYDWFALATVQWMTPWQGWIVDAPPLAPESHQLLVARKEEKASSSWAPVPFTLDGRLRLYRPHDSAGEKPLCAELN